MTSHTHQDTLDPLISFLRRMSRRDAILVRGTAPVAGRQDWVVAVYRDDQCLKRDRIAAETIAAAREQRLIVEVDGGRWRLAKRGMDKLRGARSIADGPPARTQARATGKPHGTATVGPPPSGARARASMVPGTAKPAEGSLDWLRQRRDSAGRPLISQIEYDAGQRLAMDFERGHLRPRVTSGWEGIGESGGRRRGAPGAGVEISDAAADAQARVSKALSAAGPDFAGLLLDVCCFGATLGRVERNNQLPQRSAKVVLQFALRALARHYGMLQDDRRLTKGLETQLMHWATPDYRPGAGRWS